MKESSNLYGQQRTTIRNDGTWRVNVSTRRVLKKKLQVLGFKVKLIWPPLGIYMTLENHFLDTKNPGNADMQTSSTQIAHEQITPKW